MINVLGWKFWISLKSKILQEFALKVLIEYNPALV